MSSPSNKMKEIFQFLQVNKLEEIKKDYLLDMISFDDLRENEHGDTLLHYFFRQYDELLPVSALEFLIQCFFRVDHYNNEDKTAVHILLERHSIAFKYIGCFVKKGIPLFQKKGESLSIFELLISQDNLNVFVFLLDNFNFDYIRKYYYDISLSLAIKYESMSIFKMLINDQQFHLNVLFEEFLNQTHLPTDEDDDTSANSQFFLAIKNSKKQIFHKIFKLRPNDKFITLEMLYHCSNTSFCIYISKFIKEGEYSKISIQNDQNIPPELFRLVKDINSEVYGSRSIIHQAVKDGKLDFIRQIPPIMYDALDYSGNTPLYYAIKFGKNEVAKYLLKYGNCDFCHLGKKSTPLHVAVKGHPEILKKMLSIVNKKKYNFSFDINVKDRKGNTPLLAPFYLDPSKKKDQKDINPSCLRLIVENGADITACDSKGNNILFYTFMYYFDLLSSEFASFVLSKKNLSINEDGKKQLLIQLYDQKNRKILDLFHERIETDAETLKIIFNKCNAPKIEKLYLILKEKGKENDFFFECLKTANENVFESMLKTVDNLVFYIDEKDDNNNVLFILANSFFNKSFASIITIIFELIIENNCDDFLFAQSKENGDNFLHLAIRRRNDSLIKIFLDIYQKIDNQILSKLNDNKDRIWSLVNKLFNQKNNDEKNKQSPIELGMFEIQNFHIIFHSEIFNIFQKEPSIDELENFLKQYHSPNIIYKDEPLLLKYVRYDKFNEDEMLKILELFNSYDCNFIVNQNNEYAALILLKKYYFKALSFLLDHRGLGKYAANIHDILKNSKKASEILNLYNNSKNSLYVVKLYNDKKNESSIESLNEEQENLYEPMNFADDPQKDEFIMKYIENSQEETIKITNNRENVKIINNYLNDIRMENLINEIMEDHRNLTNLWDIIHDENKVDLALSLIEDKNESRNVKNNLEYFKKNEENVIIIDACLINGEIYKRLKEYANYFDAFKYLIKYIEKADAIQNIIEKTIKSEKHNDMDEKFWPILPTVQRFSTFNAHCKFMIESFEKILLYETPIEKFFDVFVPYFESVYRPFYIQILSIKDQSTNIQMTDAKGIIGSFTSITLFFSAFEGNISSLIDYNLNESMKKKLLFSKNKCSKVVQKIQVFAPHYEEFKSITKNHKIVYDIEDFDISELQDNFYQVFVKIIDSDLEIFSPEKRLNEYYLIYSNEAFLVASVDSDEVHFLLKKSTSNVFCETFYYHNQSRLTLFTFDGMIEFEQIDLNEIKLKTLNNIGELMIKNKIKKLNKFFEDQWNLQRKLDINSEKLININISHVDITMHPIVYHFKYKRNADVNEVKEVGVNQISQNLYKNDPSMALFYLEI